MAILNIYIYVYNRAVHTGNRTMLMPRKNGYINIQLIQYRPMELLHSMLLVKIPQVQENCPKNSEKSHCKVSCSSPMLVNCETVCAL